MKRRRGTLHKIGLEVLVGGSTAVSYDVRQASERDLRAVIPAILAVVFIVRRLLLRSLVAPLILVLANVLSFGGTLGVSALMFNQVFDFPGSDPAAPLDGFVLLAALAIDYSTFLMTRVREECAPRSTRPGTLLALAVTGGVITSAGIVLAATFAALAINPIPVPGTDRLHRRFRCSVGHHGGPLAAGASGRLRVRPAHLVAPPA